MNKREIVEIVSKRANMSNVYIEKVFSIVKDLFVEVLNKGGKIKLKGFGAMEVRESKERLFENMITKRRYYSGGKKYVKIKLYKNFKFSVK